MRVTTKLTSLAIAIAITSGCASSGTTEQIISREDGYRQVGYAVWDKTGASTTTFNNDTIPTNQSRLVFIRSPQATDLKASGNIGIDNRFQSSLQQSNYTSVYTCAGDRKINIAPTSDHSNDLDKDAQTHEAKAGETQYYYVDLDASGNPTLKAISEQNAQSILQQLTPAKQTHQISRVQANNCVAPIKEPVVKVEIDKPISLHVEFDYDKATIRPQYNARLVAVAKFLEERPNTVVLIEGHTDSRGNDDYNQDLSERRAAAVRQQLIARYGVDPERISSAGFGETRPVASNDTDEGRQRNRRVDALITLKK